jgi:hypothetical protein
MEILIGAILFCAGVALLAYAPGKLVLHFLRCPLSRIEDAALSCLAGLVASCGAYAGFAYCGAARLFPLWPLAVALAFLGTFRRRIRGPRAVFRLPPPGAWRAEHAALAAVFLAGVAVFASLPTYYTNFTWRKDGSMRAVEMPDPVLHLSIANELTHTFPPQTPIFSGFRLSYHFGGDLVTAMFANGTGVDTRDLTLRFVPTLFLGLSMLAVFSFSRRWLGSGWFAALATALVFFGEDFSFIPGLLSGERRDWSIVYFQVPSVFSLFAHNPMLPGVGLLFAGLFSLQAYLLERRLAWWFVASAFFAVLVEVKIFPALQALGSLGLGGVAYVALFRDVRLLKVFATSSALALPLLLAAALANRHGGQLGFELSPWPYVSQAMEVLGFGGISSGLPGYALVALPAFLLGILGLRVVGIPATLGALFRPRDDGGIRFVVAAFVVVGFAATLTCRFGPAGVGSNYYNNSSWFLTGSKDASWIFAVEFIQRCHRRLAARHGSRAWIGAGLAMGSLALALPSSLQSFGWLARSYGACVPFDRAAAGAAQFVGRTARPGDVVLCEPAMIYPILGLTRCRIPFWEEAEYVVPREAFEARSAARRAFWSDWAGGRVRPDILREFKVRYVVASLQAGPVPARLPPGLVPIFSNPEFAVLRLDSGPRPGVR